MKDNKFLIHGFCWLLLVVIVVIIFVLVGCM